MSVKETLLEVLAKTSDSFKKLQAIKKWDMQTVWGNLDTILQAAKDAFVVIETLKATAGNIVDDEKAQTEIAQMLDDAIKLNAVLEAFDGLVFQVLVQMACKAAKPYIVAKA